MASRGGSRGEESQQKAKKDGWTEDLACFLLYEIKDRDTVLFGDEAGMGKGTSASREAWSEIRVLLAARGLFKDETQISKKFSNIKQSAKRKERESREGTGGGKGIKLSRSEELWYELFDDNDELAGIERPTDMALMSRQRLEATTCSDTRSQQPSCSGQTFSVPRENPAARKTSGRQPMTTVTYEEDESVQTFQDADDEICETPTRKVRSSAAGTRKKSNPKQGNDGLTTIASSITNTQTASGLIRSDRATSQTIGNRGQQSTSSIGLAEHDMFRSESTDSAEKVRANPPRKRCGAREEDLNKKWSRNLDQDYEKTSLEIVYLNLKIRKLKQELDVPEQ